ncbi:hypothetical protein MGAST_15980 [Mycobacterium gastri 'Wayne']|uniref:Uncharacterized protein n=1 Tax=Mycobacterium gastri TaxID=1777 RepID=A0A1X1VE30_MYCGS|nr:hypothetical protein MGAST_15980 [Mycobacterium gastri 'Wayne']ORV67372.1 hypothetical protein AWC07_09425 [Mycobacterium gastri]
MINAESAAAGGIAPTATAATTAATDNARIMEADFRRLFVFAPGSSDGARVPGNRTPANLHTDTRFTDVEAKSLTSAAVGPRNTAS